MSRERLPLVGDRRDRVAVVTGGAQGIGAGIAQRLAQWGAAGLVLCNRNMALGEAVRAEIEALGTACVFVHADLAAFLLSDHSGLMTGVAIDQEQWVAGAPP